MIKNIILLLALSSIVLSSCSIGKIDRLDPPDLAPVDSPVDIPIKHKNYYINEDGRYWINTITEIVNCITENKDFHKEIVSYPKYEHYSGSKEDIVKSLLSSKVVTVGTYYKKYSIFPKRNITRAYRNIGSNKIWINRANVANRADKDLANTFIHERLHVLGYGHKGNKYYLYNNLESVPYKVGSISEKYFEVCKND